MKGTSQEGITAREYPKGVQVAKAAFITYNTVGDAGTIQTGWHERNGNIAFVGQNSKGLAWGASVTGRPPIWSAHPEDLEILKSGNDQERERVAQDCRQTGEKRREAISDLYSQLTDVLPQMDHIVVYLGASGSEKAIDLVSHLPLEKITFVSCKCSLERKLEMVAHFKLESTRVVWCECGGHEMMHELFKSFMRTGNPLAALSVR